MFKLSKSNNINLAGIYEKAEDLIASVPFIKKRRRRRRILKILRYFFLCLIGLIVLSIILGAGVFLNFRQVYRSASAARDNLTQAISLAGEREFAAASVASKKAEEDFNLASLHLQRASGNFFVSRFPFLQNQLNNLGYLIKSGEILSKSVYQAAAIGQGLDILFLKRVDLSFSRFSPEEKREILKLIYESGPELAGLKANLDLAYFSLDQVRFKGIFWLLENKINKIKVELKEGGDLLERAVAITEVLPFWAGYPSKTSFLVLLQNNDELRPTGGFLGTCGILEVKDGDIARFDTHDIYHLDMPVKDEINIVPPEPLKKYLEADKWFMRDANWSPDWPTAASQIEWFFKEEDSLLPPANQINNFRGEFSGIIAITPKFVTDLLAITGPVFVSGEEYNKDNFQHLLQYKVEAGYIQLGIPSWQRKEVIGELIKELKIKLFDLPFSSWRQILATVSENILEKDILIYLKDESAQKLVKDFGGAGEIKEADGDYLMVVDANLAAAKTDAVMNKSINYELEQKDDGLFVKLKISYAHNGDFDWRTTRYRTYTRIYVPEGAKLTRVKINPVRNSSGAFPPEAPARQPARLQARIADGCCGTAGGDLLQRLLRQPEAGQPPADNPDADPVRKLYFSNGAEQRGIISNGVNNEDKDVSEVDITNEFDKTVFGAFVSIEPGGIGSLDFEYELPADLNELAKNGNYSLYLQKQPGNDIENLKVDLRFQNKVKSYNPTGFSAERESDAGIRWETDLKTDKRFEVNF